ncbi:MAG TPA: acyl-CoA dehydrogenase family protein [Steroidobacteraceae bacterium]|nr:acyl-CoA dehydrogenase family protein [Steroidobacteraceae bacterium]
MTPSLRLNPALLTAGHEQFRATVRRFVERELEPHVARWDEAGEFPRELYARAAAAGLFAPGFPERHGGCPDTDSLHRLVCGIELAQCGAGGVLASLLSHTIAAPPIASLGSDDLQQRVLPRVLAGEWIAALAVTEPTGGSDVAALRTTARREGDDYIVDGEKTFITSGMRADVYTVAVRTDPGSRGARGISLLLIERDAPGFTRTALPKMGWWASDTAHLRFDGVRVPAANLLGAEGEGFRAVMHNFNAERYALAANALGFAWACYVEALEWARARRTFGQRLVDHQVVRHRFVDMLSRIEATRALLEDVAWRLDHEPAGTAEVVAAVCIAKNTAARTMQFCADAAVQTLGGLGYVRGTKSERIYREVKVNMIGGGSEEVLKDLVARQLGY